MDHDIYSPYQKKIRSLLKRARLSRGMTQKVLGEVIGEHQTFVSKYERGERVLNSTEWIEILKRMGEDPQRVAKILAEMF